MAENNTNLGMPEANITALKETLCVQQQLLQKLYAELDVERESSATAVSEALSMILRLQGEKSAVVMEASQYKRMTEEEICHAEETLAIYEDMMYQKEMEISALEFQVQAYKCKLLSLGCADLGDSEGRFQDNLSLLRNDAEIGSNQSVRKLKSLPAITRQTSLNAVDKVLNIMEEKDDQEVNEQSLVLRKNSGKSAAGVDFNSYWDQIRRLDEKVKAIADYKDGGGSRDSTNLKGVFRSYSLFSSLSSGTSCDSRRYEINSLLEQLKDSKSALESQEVTNSAPTSCVYDVYEVRDITEDCKNHTNEEKRQKKVVWEGKNRLGKPDPVIEEVFESHVNDETECIKPMLLGAKEEKKISCNTRDASVQCKLALVQPIVNDCHESDLGTLNRRIERLETERNRASEEIVREGWEDQLNLLREIRGQLDSIKTEMISLKDKKSSQHEDSCLVSLKDALLHFWL